MIPYALHAIRPLYINIVRTSSAASNISRI